VLCEHLWRGGDRRALPCTRWRNLDGLVDAWLEYELDGGARKLRPRHDRACARGIGGLVNWDMRLKGAAKLDQ
jgi:hypothetical protein